MARAAGQTGARGWPARRPRASPACAGGRSRSRVRVSEAVRGRSADARHVARWVPGGGARMTIPTARPEIPTAAYRDRLERLTGLTGERGFEAVLVGVGPDLEYLTGYRAMPLERLTLLVVARGAQPSSSCRASSGRRPRPGPASTCRSGPGRRPRTRTRSRCRDSRRLLVEVRFAVSDRLWASHLLAFQARLAADDRFDAYAFGLASALLGRAAGDQGSGRDRAAADGRARRRSGRRGNRRRPAGRADRGRRRARGPRAADRRGP